MALMVQIYEKIFIFWELFPAIHCNLLPKEISLRYHFGQFYLAKGFSLLSGLDLLLSRNKRSKNA